MKRYGNLIEQITEYKNLNLAFYKASRGKRLKSEIIQYEQKLNDNLRKLQNQINTGRVDVGNYHYFKIYDPKERVICAASFPERVLHHAIMNICHPIFEKKLIHTTYATRPEKGIYKAIDLAKKSIIKYKYVAKLDVRKYFDSISHRIMKAKLEDIFKDPVMLDIFYKIIDSYESNHIQKFSCVFTDCQFGLPIGNLTSQYFANYYLDAIDRYVKQSLKAPVYIRYMDDMLIFDNDKQKLKEDVKHIEFVAGRGLKLEIKPANIYTQKQGVPFLGYKILPYQLRLNSNSKKRFINKYKLYTSFLESGFWTEKQYQEHITPLFAFVMKADTKSLRKKVLFGK